MKLFTARNIVNHIPTIFPNPGSENYALNVNTSLPNYDAGGAGRIHFLQMQIFSQNKVTTNMYPAYGMGGLLTGQFISQPLTEAKN